MTLPPVLRLPALRFRQGSSHDLFAFVVDGKVLSQFATVSRVRREDEGRLLGYQRPEVHAHIAEIRRYLESDNPLIPNAIVVAFDARVTFRPLSHRDNHVAEGFGEHGMLEVPIPVEPGSGNPLPGWIVDGQQRSAALREASVTSFPICVVAFVATNPSDQREHFIRVNSAKPLPRDLLDELITETPGVLDSAKERRKFPLVLRNRLNYQKTSPFFGRIRTPTVPGGVITSSAVVKMIGNSLSDGALFPMRYPAPESAADSGPDVEGMTSLLRRYWRAVAAVFPEAWERPPKRSRLTHGAGIVAMGFLMDGIVGRSRSGASVMDEEGFAGELDKVRPACAWTTGEWDLGGGRRRRWDEIQNTPNDVELLSGLLLRTYQKTNTKPSEQDGLLHRT